MPDPPQVITNEVFYSLKHPLQRRRFVLALFFALILFPLIGVGLVAGTVFLVVPLFALFLWLSARILFARFLGNCILVSELNYPRIHHISEDLKAEIGFKKPVIIFVYEQGNFNAYLYKFLFYRRAVFLNSELLEAGVTDDELRWLVGRFIGYLRARRQAGFWGWTIRAAQHLGVFNIFLLPYERALVYSGDRIALQVIHGDVSTAVSAMQKLLVGRQLGYSVNPGGMVDQHRQVKGSFFAFLARIGSGFPHMTARYVDLIEFAKVRYPEQFARFEVENPGLPADLGQLGALPQAAPSSGRDPVLIPLGGAIIVLALLTLFTVKVLVPRLNQPSTDAMQYSPAVDENASTTTASPPPQPDTSTTPAPQPQPDASTDQQSLVQQQKFTWSLQISNGEVQVSDGAWTNGSSQAVQSANLQCIQYGQDGSVLAQGHITLTKSDGTPIQPGQTVTYGAFNVGDAAQGVDKVGCTITSVTAAQ